MIGEFSVLDFEDRQKRIWCDDQVWTILELNFIKNKTYEYIVYFCLSPISFWRKPRNQFQLSAFVGVKLLSEL